MTASLLTAEQERAAIQRFFDDSRLILQNYLQERQLALSNSQLFAFVLISPVTLAIASDGNLDLSETTMLVDIASYFDRILPTEFDVFAQPENPLSDKEFKRKVYSELRYLCVSMGEYEKQLINALKCLIELDDTLSKDASPLYSIRHRVKDMMHSVIYNNMGKDHIEEAKIQKIFRQLGIE